MRIRTVVLALVPLALSCGDHRPDPRLGPPAAPASTHAVEAHAPVPEWLPVDKPDVDSLAPTEGDPDGGVLVRGQRITKTGAAPEVAVPPLVGGARVPKHLGGGFLFWSASAVYFAKGFQADLEPIVHVEAAPQEVSFGRGVALVHLDRGGRLALSWPAKRPAPMPVAGLVDLGTLADGRGVLLAEPNLTLTQAASKTAWRDATADALVVTRLHRTDTELWLERADGSAARVEADGSLSIHGRVPMELLRRRVKVPDPRWPRNSTETPLARAVRRGVPIDDHTVAIEVAGAFAKVDLDTGALVAFTRAVLANPRECELLPVGSEVLALCRLVDRSHVVISGVGGTSPKVERSFASPGKFFSGSPGALLFSGPCEGKTDGHPAVCVRQRDGSWRQLAASPGPGDAGSPAPPPSIARWVPTSDGAALGLVGGPSGGVYDPATGTLTAFTANPRPVDSALFVPPADLVVDDLAMADDGRFVGYSRDASLTLTRDGTLERSPHRFTALTASGALALATDSAHRLWQSIDFGRRWVEVDRPPGVALDQSLSLARCSRVGCELSGWFRIGYKPTAPRVFQARVAALPALAPPAKLPRLVCERTSPPKTRWTTRLRNASGELTEEFEFGARKVSAREGTLESIPLHFEEAASELVIGATLVESDLDEPNAARFRALVGRPRAMRFIDLFGEMRVVDSRFSWQDVLVRAARESGEAPAGPSTDDRYATLVLGERPFTTAGLSVQDPAGALLWFRAGQAASVLSLGRENREFKLRSAIAKGKGELVVLSEEDSCVARVIALTSAGARTLLELPARASRRPCPANPDALAQLEDGRFGVLRLPSKGPPTADDPALVLEPRRQPVSLAPWSTLTACGPDAKGLRAMITIPRRWVELDAPGLAAATEPHTLAVVRWSETQVCAESLAVAAPPVPIGDEELPTTVVARFGKAPRADRRGFALGAEHTEDLACKLVP